MQKGLQRYKLTYSITIVFIKNLQCKECADTGQFKKRQSP